MEVEQVGLSCSRVVHRHLDMKNSMGCGTLYVGPTMRAMADINLLRMVALLCPSICG